MWYLDKPYPYQDATVFVNVFEPKMIEHVVNLYSKFKEEPTWGWWYLPSVAVGSVFLQHWIQLPRGMLHRSSLWVFSKPPFIQVAAERWPSKPKRFQPARRSRKLRSSQGKQENRPIVGMAIYKYLKIAIPNNPQTWKKLGYVFCHSKFGITFSKHPQIIPNQGIVFDLHHGPVLPHLWSQTNVLPPAALELASLMFSAPAFITT